MLDKATDRRTDTHTFSLSLTFRIRNTFCSSTTTVVTRTLLNVTLYVLCLSCNRNCVYCAVRTEILAAIRARFSRWDWQYGAVPYAPRIRFLGVYTETTLPSSESCYCVRTESSVFITRTHDTFRNKRRDMYRVVISTDKRCLSDTITTLCVVVAGYGMVEDVSIVESFVAFSRYYWVVW